MSSLKMDINVLTYLLNYGNSQYKHIRDATTQTQPIGHYVVSSRFGIGPQILASLQGTLRRPQ